MDKVVENICFSGGAEGADTLFGDLAEVKGHKVVHYHFRNSKRDVKNFKVLNEFYLIQADPFLTEANKYIRRKYPTRTVDIDNLLRRNYYQIVDTNRIYAVTAIGDRGIPTGGTAWAVVMGILNGVRETYVYDQVESSWYKFSSLDKDKKFIKWHKATDIPAPKGKYTGIGSRALTEGAASAIRKLYI